VAPSGISISAPKHPCGGAGGRWFYLPALQPGTYRLIAEGVAGDGTIDVVDPDDLDWQPLGADSGTPAGIVMKQLRVDPERGDWTYFVACAPYWQAPQAETHPTVQEAFMLRGDVLLGECGVMEPGCYFWRPPLVPHGPIFTHDGALFIFRVKGGSWEVSYHDIPGWEELVEAYKAREPFFRQAATRGLV